MRLVVKGARSFRCTSLLGLHHAILIVEHPAQIVAGLSRILGEHTALPVLPRSHRGPLPLSVTADGPVSIVVECRHAGVLRPHAARVRAESELGR